jgi:FMN reductase (NADPH)
MTDVISTLNSHVSQRKYTDQEVNHETVRELINAARRSPTSSNMQAYSFVVVRNQETKNQLAVLAGNQKHIETCAVFIAICADISRLMKACEMHGTELARNTENLLVSTVDAAIVGMSLSTAAESKGIGTVMIGGIRNHPEKVAKLLKFPEGVYVVYGMCLGFPQKALQQKPRLPEEAVIHYESYDSSDPTSHLEAYDAELAEHYRSTNRKTPDAAWTGVIAQKFSKFQRPKLKATLEKLGFRLD